MEEPKNVLVSYATGSGRKVGDGEGRNSPFTAALLKHIEEPGIELIALMKRVKAAFDPQGILNPGKIFP